MFPAGTLQLSPEATIGRRDDDLLIRTPWMDLTIKMPGCRQIDDSSLALDSELLHSMIRFPVVVTRDYDTLAKYCQVRDRHAPSGLNRSADCVAPSYDSAAFAFVDLRHRLFQRAGKIADINLDATPAVLAKTLGRSLQQSYYVTTHALHVLALALDVKSPPGYLALLRRYLADETGHARFVAEALTDLGIQPSEAAASNGTIALLDCLERQAKSDPLALSIGITFMEMGAYLDRDPVADTLENLGFVDGAKSIRKHFEINRRGQHQHIGFELALALGGREVRELDTLLVFIDEMVENWRQAMEECLTS